MEATMAGSSMSRMNSLSVPVAEKHLTLCSTWLLKDPLPRPSKTPKLTYAHHAKLLEVLTIIPEYPVPIIPALEVDETLVPMIDFSAPSMVFPGTVPVLSIGAVCVGIFGYYHLLQQQLGIMNDPIRDRKHLRLIDKHMVLSLENWRAGRWWTLLTSTITHYSPVHLAINMFTLSSCGPAIILLFGLPTFATLWILGGVAGGASQLYIDQQPRQRGVIRKGLGASACLCAMEAVLTCANPNAVVSLSGVLLPQWLGTAAFAGWSVAAFSQGWAPGIGHEAHLGGLAAGVAVWFGALRWFAPSLGLQLSRLYGV